GGSVSAGARRFVIAVDGPSGTGKSSVSREVAHRIGAGYLDTGAMYRVATLHALRGGLDTADQASVIAAVRDLPMEVGSDPFDTRVWLAGADVAEQIRTAAVDS